MENKCIVGFYRCIDNRHGTGVSSWSNPSNAPPLPQNYPNVSYGFINVYTSHPTHPLLNPLKS